MKTNRIWRCDLKSPCVKYCESKNNKHQCGIYKRDNMKKQELTKIIKFIESEIHRYDIEFDFEIEENILQVEFNGTFTNNQPISMSFQVAELDSEIYFEAISESWILAETREFWIDFMVRIYE